MLRCTLFSVLGTLALTAGAPAQGLVYEIRGSAAAGVYQPVAVGDMTGDSVPDLIVANDRKVDLYSGKDGTRARTIVALDGQVTALAGGRDVDADGVPDVLLAIQSLSRVELRSGKNGFLMRQWSSLEPLARFGTWVAFLDDLDADGRPDVMVGAPGTWSFPLAPAAIGFVVAYSSFTGNERARFTPDPSTEIVSVSPGGDLDGDSRQDLAIGLAYRFRRYDRLSWYDYYSPIALAWTPSSLAQRTLLQPASNIGTGPGYQVAVTGDVDLDAGAEVIACEGAATSLVSGRTAAVIRSHVAPGSPSMPHAVGDLDADGTIDYVLAASAASRVHIHSGKTGILLWSQIGAGNFGAALAVVGNLDADPGPEVAILSPNEMQGGLLGVFTYRLTSWKAGFVTLLEPTGKPAKPPGQMLGTGAPVVGGQLSFEINAVGYDVAVVLMGLGFHPGLVAPIPGNPLLLYLDDRLVLPFSLPLALIGGRGVLALPVPQGHQVYGLDVGLQAALFAYGPPLSYGSTNLLIAKLGFAGPLGATLHRLDLALRAKPGDNYRNALGTPARLLINRGPAVDLTVLGSKSAGGPIELRTEPGAPPTGGGLLLGTIGTGAGSFEVRVQVPSGQTTPVGVYLLSRDPAQDVEAQVAHLRLQ